MNADSPVRAMAVAVGVALVCSVLVSTTRVLLAPGESVSFDPRLARHVVAAAGLVPAGGQATEAEVARLFADLRAVAVDLEAGAETVAVDPATFDARAAAEDPALGVPIPKERDAARLGRRARYAVVFRGTPAGGIVLPIVGKGMWSTIGGYIGLGPDLETITGLSFYEQAETPGIGDRFLDPAWLAGWRGKRIHDDAGALRIAVLLPRPDGAPERNRVDAISGATVTTESVGAMVRYWLGEDGFGPYLDGLRASGGAP